MQRLCDTCTRLYEAKRVTSRFCSPRCQKRAQRSPVGLSSTTLVTFPNPVDGPLTVATMAELIVADRVESSLGQAALLMARRLDMTSADTGSSVAALAREQRATLALALESATNVLDPADQLRLQREARIRKRRGTGSVEQHYDFREN